MTPVSEILLCVCVLQHLLILSGFAAASFEDRMSDSYKSAEEVLKRLQDFCPSCPDFLCPKGLTKDGRNRVVQLFSLLFQHQTERVLEKHGSRSEVYVCGVKDSARHCKFKLAFRKVKDGKKMGMWRLMIDECVFECSCEHRSRLPEICTKGLFFSFVIDNWIREKGKNMGGKLCDLWISFKEEFGCDAKHHRTFDRAILFLLWARDNNKVIDLKNLRDVWKKYPKSTGKKKDSGGIHDTTSSSGEQSTMYSGSDVYVCASPSPIQPRDICPENIKGVTDFSDCTPHTQTSEAANPFFRPDDIICIPSSETDEYSSPPSFSPSDFGWCMHSDPDFSFCFNPSLPPSHIGSESDELSGMSLFQNQEDSLF